MFVALHKNFITKVIMENRKTYSFEEAYQASLVYFGGDELAARVWVNKYALKDSYGNLFEKTPADMHWRIANEVARIETVSYTHLTLPTIA